MLKNRNSIIELINKEEKLIITTFVTPLLCVDYDINVLLKINISYPNQFQNKEYFANLSRALVKTLRKYCVKELFINKEDSSKYNEYNFQILLFKPFKNANRYGYLFKLISEKLKISPNCFTNEIKLQAEGYSILSQENSSRLEQNCMLVSYDSTSKKIFFLEKSRGNINKDYLMSYLSKL